MIEIWKETEFENYLVSNFARVLNVSLGKFISISSHMNRGTYSGYKTVWVAGKHRKLHRLVAKAFIPNLKGKPFVNHKDGNPGNNIVDNLEWVTARENSEHAIKTGLLKVDKNPNLIQVLKGTRKSESKKGANNPRSKLTPQCVISIMEMYKSKKYTIPYIASKYGVSTRTIHQIKNGQRWSYLGVSN